IFSATGTPRWNMSCHSFASMCASSPAAECSARAGGAANAPRARQRRAASVSPHGSHRARPVGPALAFARAIRKGAFVALNERILPPSPVLLALEGRAWLEFAALVPALPLLARAPRGDGHPVLVLPGWLASDRSTWALRRFLRDRGYHVHGWRLGRNLGPDAGTVAGLWEGFAALRARHGRGQSIICWSHGRIYARQPARRYPPGVR